jgi:hypothetical protein
MTVKGFVKSGPLTGKFCFSEQLSDLHTQQRPGPLHDGALALLLEPRTHAA